MALSAGGKVTNGTSLDVGAVISGQTGVQISGAAGTVTNFGTIEGQGVGSGAYGVYLRAGGSVTNGGGGDHAALIEGADGAAVKGGASATVKNFGTIMKGREGAIAVSFGAIKRGR